MSVAPSTEQDLGRHPVRACGSISIRLSASPSGHHGHRVIFREAFNCLIKPSSQFLGGPIIPSLPRILLKRTKFVTFSTDLAGRWVGGRERVSPRIN